MLVLDGGDALFRRLTGQGDAPPTPAEEARARAILEAMGAMGTDAMAVGPRDLAGGLALLREGAKAAGIALVSANLLDAKGARVFPATTVLVRGGLKIGVVGISTADMKVAEARAVLGAGLTASEPLAAARAAIASLEGEVDLILLLGRLGVGEMRRILPKLSLPLAFVGSTGQLLPWGERQGRALLYDGGFRGQVLQRVDLLVRGPGLFTDPNERQAAPLPAGFVAPNEARAKAIYLEALGPVLPEIDEALEAYRLPEEKKLRAERAKKPAPGPRGSTRKPAGKLPRAPKGPMEQAPR